MRYENFPWWIVIFSNLVSLAIYTSGLFIIYHVSLIFALLYLVFILVLEYQLIRTGCINCYYYGKLCGFGKGKSSGWLFKKGDPAKFCARDFSWKDLIPDILISAIPLLTGIVLLIIEFNFFLLLASVLVVLFTTFGNQFIRGKLTCANCKQRERGCPAFELFNKG